jgi:hypothetical protein
VSTLRVSAPLTTCLAVLSLGCTEVVTNLVSDNAGDDGRQTRDAQTDRDGGSGRDAARAPDGPGDAAAPDAEDGYPADATVDPQPVLCNNKPCACDNNDDDDGDGLSDGLDPECTGPYDDDESSFATGNPGDNRESCQDCFFDGNSGHGDDGCQVNLECLFGRVPESLAGAGCPGCEVSAECVDNCLPRTPNGCDCFGCCEMFRPDGSRLYVLLDPDCSLDRIDDPVACPRCVPSAECANPCGNCELCPGKVLDDLPETCAPAPQEPGPGYTCDNGERVCGDGLPCPEAFYCHMGCCLQAIF